MRCRTMALGLALTLASPCSGHAQAAPAAQTADSLPRIVLLSPRVEDSSQPRAPQVRTLHVSSDPATGATRTGSRAARS